MRYRLLLTSLAGLVLLPRASAQAKKPNAITSAQRMMVGSMLENVRDTLEHNYYDPAFHGVNLKAEYEKYHAEIERAPTLGDAFREIAAFLSEMNDSHTFFLPPPRSWDQFYGYRMRMIGDRAFITAVRPDTDAAGKLHPGDEIVSLEGYSVNRADFWPLTYSLNALQPRGGLHFKLRAPDGTEREVVTRTKFVQHGGIVTGQNQLYDYAINQDQLDAKLYRLRWVEAGKAFVWQLPNFEFDPSAADGVMARAKKFPSLVLDLRGNPGGAVDALKYMLGYFVTKKITIATRTGRRHQGKDEAGPNHDHYPGKLFVVVDSRSASAAELFARTVQLQHLGTVIGETTSGAVMEAMDFPMHYGEMDMGAAIFYGASVTVNDLVMPDGGRLENHGVIPDVVVLPTAADMAAGRDTVLARAVQLAGGTADAATLAAAFPVIWPPYTYGAN